MNNRHEQQARTSVISYSHLHQFLYRLNYSENNVGCLFFGIYQEKTAAANIGIAATTVICSLLKYKNNEKIEQTTTIRR